MKKKDRCLGCRNIIYDKCCFFKDAKLIKGKLVSSYQMPPFNQKPSKFLECYKKIGYVLLNCEKEDKKY